MLLENLPHLCTIRRRVRTKDSLGGNKDTFTDEQTNVACWEQAASESESQEFEKRGMIVSGKVFFVSDPNVTRRHQILITSRQGTAVASPDVLDVVSVRSPDDSVGLRVLWAVLCNRNTGKDD